MSEAARSHRSDMRVEPFMDSPAPARAEAANPLAELAQLVGQDDPFRRMFRQGKAGQRPAADPVVAFPVPDHAPQDQVYPDHADHDHEAEAHYAEEPHGYDEAGQPLGLRPTTHDAEDWQQDHAEPAQWDDTHEAVLEDGAHYPSEAEHSIAADAQAEPAHYGAAPLTPDLWADRGREDTEAHAPQIVPSDEDAADPKSPRRPLIVLMAVLALTGGGLAATFLSRSGSSSVAASNGAAPTIMAASGPTKIKQTDGATDTTPEDADALLLNKNGTSGGGPVKVLNSQEQPLDLAQLPKSTTGQSDASSDPAAAFPAPKKVKTFLVRPDGSLVNSTAPRASAAPVQSTVPQFAAGAVSDGDATDVASGPPPVAAPRPSTPKNVNHASTTPKAAPASIADLADAGGDAPKQAASPGVKSAGGGKPVEMADATVTDTTSSATASGGNFALQLAASPSEQDARGAFTKLQKKYSELDGLQPTVKKVDNGQKTIYRLRVGNLSQDQAKTLCSKLQASGGSCFVVHN